MLCKVTQCAGHVSANTMPYELCWGDRRDRDWYLMFKLRWLALSIRQVEALQS